MFTDNEQINKMNIKNLFSVIWSKIAIKFGKEYSKEPIPEGFYCYTINTIDFGTFSSRVVIDTTLCPYYKHLWGHWNGCKYCGIITDDFLFADDIKICDIKEGALTDYEDEL